MVAVNTQQRYRHCSYVPLQFLVSPSAVVVDAGITQYDEQIFRTCALVLAKVLNALKLPVGIAGEIDALFSPSFGRLAASSIMSVMSFIVLAFSALMTGQLSSSNRDNLSRFHFPLPSASA